MTINQTPIVIGKRVTFGAMISGLVATGCWVWGFTHPQHPVPAEIAIAITAVITGIGQVLIAHFLGITANE